LVSDIHRGAVSAVSKIVRRERFFVLRWLRDAKLVVCVLLRQFFA
jgi:hypothetical protein